MQQSQFKEKTILEKLNNFNFLKTTFGTDSADGKAPDSKHKGPEFETRQQQPVFLLSSEMFESSRCHAVATHHD